MTTLIDFSAKKDDPKRKQKGNQIDYKISRTDYSDIGKPIQ